MRTCLRTTLAAAAIAVGVLTAPTAALAAPTSCHHVHQQTGDNNGILNGTQVNMPIDLGPNLTGNAVALLGLANATGTSTYHQRCGN